MSKSAVVVFCVFIVASMVASASGETFVITVNDPPIALTPTAMLVPLDFGAELSGISSVSVRVVGIGGGGDFDCYDSFYDGWHALSVDVLVGGSHNVVLAESDVSFDTVGTQSFFEANPWEYMEGTARYGMGVTAKLFGVPSEAYCDSVAITMPQIELIELTIVCDSVVANEKASWGTIKALYYGSGAH